MNNIILQSRANAASAGIDAARTPAEKHAARQEGLALHTELEKYIADNNAMAAFKAAPPQNSTGMFKDLVRDAPLFLVGPGGKKITTAVKLPDGSFAQPNPEGQIAVPARFVPALIARGFMQANSVFTDPGNPLRDPARPNA